MVLLAPLVVVIGVSFTATELLDFPPNGLSLRWYANFFGDARYVHAFFAVSLVVALAASVISTALGTLAAIGLVRFRFFGREALEAFFLTPLLVPHLLLGVALYLYYLRLQVTASIWTLMLSHVVICTPFVIRSVTAGLVGMAPRLEEAAMSLGATRRQAFLRVTMPLLRSSFASGAIFAFIISFSDVNVALFVSGPAATSLPILIFTQLQWDTDPTVAAASSLQIIIVGGLILLVQRIFRLRLMV
jgi:putative spermidine/putrescine transport system permease protein